MRTATVQARLRGCAVSPESMLFAHIGDRSRGNQPKNKTNGTAKWPGMRTENMIRRGVRIANFSRFGSFSMHVRHTCIFLYLH